MIRGFHYYDPSDVYSSRIYSNRLLYFGYILWFLSYLKGLLSRQRFFSKDRKTNLFHKSYNILTNQHSTYLMKAVRQTKLEEIAKCQNCEGLEGRKWDLLQSTTLYRREEVGTDHK